MSSPFTSIAFLSGHNTFIRFSSWNALSIFSIVEYEETDSFVSDAASLATEVGRRS